MTVVFLGMVTGATMALIYLVVRFLLPSRPLLRATIFWAVCIGLTLRGLRPVSVLNASVFLPLVLLDGALLQLFLKRTSSPEVKK